MHKWTLIIAKGNDAPGDSLDSIYWCERCGTVRHDYSHGGGMKSSSYPRYFAHNGRSGKDEPTCYSARIEPGLTELEEATVLANLVLDRPNADPDDDLAMLARQFLRARERERAYCVALREAQAAIAAVINYGGKGETEEGVSVSYLTEKAIARVNTVLEESQGRAAVGPLRQVLCRERAGRVASSRALDYPM